MASSAPSDPDAPASQRRGPSREGRRLIGLGIVGFAAVGALLFALGSRLAPATAVEPGHAPTDHARAEPDGTFVITLDARDRERWVGVDLGAGEPAPEAAADLLVRRNVIRAPGGALDLGEVALPAARVDAGPAAWLADAKIGGAVQSPAFGKWYRYSYWTHVLHPNRHVQAVRRVRGGVAYVSIESYYCEPEGAGCLTLRYRLEGDAAPR